MKKDPLTLVQDILECIDRIEHYFKGVSMGAFLEEFQLQDAVIRRIEIMGEASKNIPQAVRNRYPQVEWKAMVATRNILVHAYDEVRLEAVWRIAKKDLPVLKKQLLGIEKDLSD